MSSLASRSRFTRRFGGAFLRCTPIASLLGVLVTAASCAEDGAEVEQGAVRAHDERDAASDPRLPDDVRTRAANDDYTFYYEQRGELLLPRLFPNLAYDEARGTTMLFGGWSISTVRSDTWEWDGASWQRRQPLRRPSERFASATAYDPGLKRTLMFGGFASTANGFGVVDNEMWEWNGRDWAVVPTNEPPASRAAAASAWDSDKGELLVFGGVIRTGTGVDLASTDELWRFDGRQWTPIAKSGAWPSARAIGAMAYDRVNKRMILFGGVRTMSADSTGTPSVAGLLNDTWVWSTETNTWTELAPAHRPEVLELTQTNGDPLPLSGRGVLVRDPRDADKLMLVHEFVTGIQLWQWQNDDWVELATPGLSPNYRLFSATFADPGNETLNMIGGVGFKIPPGQTLAELIALYTQDGGSGSDLADGLRRQEDVWRESGWTERELGGEPGPRQGAAAAYDEERGNGVMFGGRFGGSALLGDTWIWDGGRWIGKSVSGPGAREGHAMAYDPVRKRVLLFGGADGSGSRDDLWAWNGSAWSSVTVNGSTPPARQGHLLLTHARGALLYGGRDDPARFQDTWIFDSASSSWSRLTTSITPSGTSASCGSAVVGGATYMYGGRRVSNNEGRTAQFLSFNPTTSQWVELGADADPHPQQRNDCLAFQDPFHGFLLVGGGEGAEQASAWFRWQADRWTGVQLQPRDALVEPPGRRFKAVHFFDKGTKTSLFYGGTSSESRLVTGDTWAIRVRGQSCSNEIPCADGSACVDGVCCEASACGPCEQCNLPEAPGYCRPRPGGGSHGACAAEQGLACNAEGRCRSSDGAQCTDDSECASGACINGLCCSAAGCVQQCIDERTEQTQGGTQRSCGAYLCRGSACLNACQSIADCAPGHDCSADGVCEAMPATGTGEKVAQCVAVPGRSAPGGVWLGSLAALALLMRRRRQAR